MNILMMTLLYPQDQLSEVTANVKDKLQNQINNYQFALISAIQSNLSPEDSLQVLNSLPVGVFPLQYRQCLLKAGTHDGGLIRQTGCINLPWFKQKGRAIEAEKALVQWGRERADNRMILVYTQYLPYMQAIAKVKRRFPDMKAVVIVTDLPNEYGLPTGRKGILKKMESRMGDRSVALLRQMDGFILLTDPMADALQIRHKPLEILEGLIVSEEHAQPPVADTSSRPTFLYTGTLEKALGIGEMLDAFARMPEYDLRICGFGAMKDAVEAAAKQYANIHYDGFVSQKEALAKQANAAALLNPRQPDGVFTRYSFPSKTLEYMRSGKPVLCCRLEGIPADYDPYLVYMEPGREGIIRAVRQLMKLPPREREAIGERGRRYVLETKNAHVQGQKILSLLNRV